MRNENEPTGVIHRKRLTGVVVSAGKMAQTITVLVERRPWHPTLRKQYRQSKRYLVHDPKQEARAGDRVTIEETRPLSKRKHFRLLRVMRQEPGAETGTPGGEGATGAAR